MPAEGRYRPQGVRVLGEGAPVPVQGSIEDVIAAIAGRQHGRLSRRQLLAAGVPARTVAKLVQRRRLAIVHRGVYAVAPPLEVRWAAEAAALLAVREGAALEGASALAAWDVLPYRGAEAPVRLVVPGTHTGRHPGIVVRHSSTLRAADLAIRHGLPVTTAARALLDHADSCSGNELRTALDEALYSGRVTHPEMRALLARAGSGRQGAPALQELLDAHGPSGVTRSEVERRLRELIFSSEIPRPYTQDPLYGYIADFHWREAGYVVEADGYGAHTLNRATFNRDRAKSRHLARRGILVDRFSWDDVTRTPLRTVAHIATMVARRTAQRDQAA